MDVDEVHKQNYAVERIVGRTVVNSKTHYMFLGTDTRLKKARGKHWNTFSVTLLPDIGGAFANGRQPQTHQYVNGVRIDFRTARYKITKAAFEMQTEGS